MDRKLLKSILFIVTYTLLLGLVLIKFDEITGLLGEMLALLRPLQPGETGGGNLPAEYAHREREDAGQRENCS